jgi:hypothetical protein
MFAFATGAATMGASAAKLAEDHIKHESESAKSCLTFFVITMYVEPAICSFQNSTNRQTRWKSIKRESVEF